MADGTRLATTSADGTVRIWDTATGAERLTLALACSGAIAWSARQLAIAAGVHWAAIDNELLARYELVPGTSSARTNVGRS